MRAIREVGLSELVRDKETTFLDGYEGKITILEPENTELVLDTSPKYRDSALYIESLLRRTPVIGDDIQLGHRAAMDVINFQLEPAVQALSKVRQRILIADAVGLGKTLEAGVLLSELIARGAGKRILVVAVKSMLTQFQKEM